MFLTRILFPALLISSFASSIGAVKIRQTWSRVGSMLKNNPRLSYTTTIGTILGLGIAARYGTKLYPQAQPKALRVVGKIKLWIDYDEIDHINIDQIMSKKSPNAEQKTKLDVEITFGKKSIQQIRKFFNVTETELNISFTDHGNNTCTLFIREECTREEIQRLLQKIDPSQTKHTFTIKQLQLMSQQAPSSIKYVEHGVWRIKSKAPYKGSKVLKDFHTPDQPAPYLSICLSTKERPLDLYAKNTYHEE